MSASPSARRVDERPIVHVIAVVALLAIAVAAGLAIGPTVGAASVQDDANESADEPGNDSTNAANATELQPIDVANASGNDTEVIQLEGEGQTVTDPISLEDGLVVAEYDHDGESNFQVDLWNESADEQAAFLVNRIGAVNGTTAAPVATGNYSLVVNADGAWNLTLVQPNTTAVLAAQAENATTANGSTANESDGSAAPANGTNVTIASAPATASGDGPTVLGPVAFDGSVTVTANHSGESNFQVELWRENATSLFGWTLVFNEIGQVEAAETRVGHSERSWVVVTADGEWDLRFD